MKKHTGLYTILGSLGLLYFASKQTSNSSLSRQLLGGFPQRQAPPIPSFNMQSQMGKMEQSIVQLLQKSKDAYEKGGSVNQIVDPFANAQDLIHSEGFKQGGAYTQSPVKMQIVEDFSNLGYKLSE
jgi:hypothetical protein